MDTEYCVVRKIYLNDSINESLPVLILLEAKERERRGEKGDGKQLTETHLLR